jgi:hypothetical protein
MENIPQRDETVVTASARIMVSKAVQSQIPEWLETAYE